MASHSRPRSGVTTLGKSALIIAAVADVYVRLPRDVDGPLERHHVQMFEPTGFQTYIAWMGERIGSLGTTSGRQGGCAP